MLSRDAFLTAEAAVLPGELSYLDLATPAEYRCATACLLSGVACNPQLSRRMGQGSDGLHT